MCFFSAKAFLILAIIIVKIVYLGFLVSRASGVAPIIQISRVLSLLKSSIVFYIMSYLVLDLDLGIELVLDLGLGSLSNVVCGQVAIAGMWPPPKTHQNRSLIS